MVDIDKLSITELQYYFQQHGYNIESYKKVYWLEYGLNLEDGLRVLETDEDIHRLYASVKAANSNELEFYFDQHLLDDTNGEARPVDGRRDDNTVCGVDIEITEVEEAIKDLTLDVSEEDDDSEGLSDDDDDEPADDDDGEGSYGSYLDGSWKSGPEDADVELQDAEDEHDDNAIVGTYHQVGSSGVRRKRSMDEQVHLELEMIFPTLNLFKMAVRDYNIALGRPVKIKLNDRIRPLIGLDGCHLKDYYGGQLLTVVAQDGNHSFYVIAYAVVEQETKETWIWFLTRLLLDIGDPVFHGWEFMSDMQKGLLPALKELAPGCTHRFCVRHLETNLWKNWKSKQLNEKMWDCARSRTMPEFERNMELLKAISEEAWKEWDISGIPCKHAVACMTMNDSDPEKFMHSYYSKETWQRIYEPYIRPVIGEDHWEKQSLDPILPPNYSRAGGRPKVKRTKGNDIPQDPYKAKRKYRKIRCGKCGQPGHNRRICKGTTMKDKRNKKVLDAITSSPANDPMMKKRRREATDIVGPSSSNVRKGREGAEKTVETAGPEDSNPQLHMRKRARTTRASTATDIAGPSSSNVRKGRKIAEKTVELLLLKIQTLNCI
ncbi:hypothetical protein CRG98_022785 [Punica granatum]|uniref:CCHC-type domain-containing protein n=1 Tax=Punica granatum TaxID=22663 RepID=A0A2I0JKS7_PUNGR|nr:hypothetical protein CRG98_022785 [Punica granatum]